MSRSAAVRFSILSTTLIALVAMLTVRMYFPSVYAEINPVMPWVKTANAAEQELPIDVESYVRSLHEQRGIAYPPKGVTLAAFKEEERLELWAETDGGPVFLKSYDFCAASGEPGPKLCRGDCQVPEGVYRVKYLNPNSRFHLSLLLDYPNSFDRRVGKEDGRSDLGSDICIHGGCKSIGCIALGDEAIEEIFLVATKVGARNCRTIIAPYDFREQGLPARYTELAPRWLPELYENIYKELAPYGMPS